jgi:hypothetical protein
MTEQSNQTSKYLEDIALYQYADVAARLASNEQTAQFASGALEKLVGDFKKALGDKAGILEGFRAGAMASEEGINMAIRTYAGEYETALGKIDVVDFYNLRLKTLTSVMGKEDAEAAKPVFEKYKGQTIASIKQKVNQANAKLKDKTGLYDKKQKEEARAVFEKLAPIYNIITLAEQRNYEELMPSTTKSVYNQMFKENLSKA